MVDKTLHLFYSYVIKTPVVIKSIQWTGYNQDEITDFVGEATKWTIDENGQRIKLGITGISDIVKLDSWIIICQEQIYILDDFIYNNVGYEKSFLF